MSYINNWIWSQKAKGYLDTKNISIITLSDTNIIISGYFYESCTFNDIILTGDNKNIFIAKMNEVGNWLWATKITTSNNEEKYSIKALSDDSIIIAGTYNSSIIFGNIILSKYNLYDTYVAKISQNGDYIWAINTDSITYNYFWDLSLSNDDSIYITGYFFSEIIVNQTTITANDNTLIDMYVAKIDNSGNWLWINNAGGINYDYYNKIAALSDGSVIIVGAVTDICNFGNSFTINDVSNNVSDKLCIYVAKIDNSGNWLWVSTFYNNIINDYSLNLTVSLNDYIYIAGYFSDTITIDNTTLTSYGINDIFITQIDNSGNWLWTRQGGNVNTNGMCLKSLLNNSVIIVCNVNENSFFDEIVNNDAGLVVANIFYNGTWNYVELINISSDMNNYYIDDMCINSKYGYITGYFSDIIQNNNNTLISNGSFDIYVIKVIVDYTNTSYISNILLAEHIIINNSLFEDKQNLIKELYDIQNFKKYTLNYMLKRIINTDIDYLPDPTANLINLYHVDADTETMILQNLAKKYKQSMTKIELEIDPIEIEEKRLRILNNSINLYHLNKDYQITQNNINKRYDKKEKEINISIKASSLLNLYYTNIDDNINTNLNKYRYTYNQTPEIIENNTCINLVKCDGNITIIPKTSLLGLYYNLKHKQPEIIDTNEDTVTSINKKENIISIIPENSLLSLHYNVKSKKISDKNIVHTINKENSFTNYYKVKSTHEEVIDEECISDIKQISCSSSIAHNSLASLHYKVKSKQIQPEIIDKKPTNLTNIKSDHVSTIAHNSLASLHYKVKSKESLEINNNIDTNNIDTNNIDTKIKNKIITNGSLINLHHKQTKNVQNKHIKENKNNPTNNLINLYYTTSQDNLLKKSNNKKK